MQTYHNDINPPIHVKVVSGTMTGQPSWHVHLCSWPLTTRCDCTAGKSTSCNVATKKSPKEISSQVQLVTQPDCYRVRRRKKDLWCRGNEPGMLDEWLNPRTMFLSALLVVLTSIPRTDRLPAYWAIAWFPTIRVSLWASYTGDFATVLTRTDQGLPVTMPSGSRRSEER